ncbi:ABC transporter ATP-binding protein [Neobacillus cucumis]|uniref:ABC transporter ATP-binding protein n=1 Tax=Neobacillus cucumis TaxID=1740721 RepID=UPI0028531197|nr:ABC transporter ATP-binding protein [Neobacillus cucumis]MDR4947256.1 ABC transporter ATP-binding protein [Neobacillus cucumis]
MSKLLKGIIDKLFNTNQKPSEPEIKSISQEEIEAIVEARLREHAATIEKSVEEKVNSAVQVKNQEDYSLSPKQIDFALDIIKKTGVFELATDTANLTIKDLNKLIAYNKFKNKGILVNLVKKGVLKRK